MRLLTPNKVPFKVTAQITGEVIAPKTVENSRNFAAGSLNLKDMDEFVKRPLVFVAYDVTPNPERYWSMSMTRLSEYGFSVIGPNFNTEMYPTDGTVYRLNDNQEFKKLGYTNHHPRGAFALKKQAQGVVTKLQDVVWQVGRSGVVSPVAILEPVMIGDAKVSRATLHNLAYIEELGLELGCNVEVIRSGEIIPRIVRRV